MPGLVPGIHDFLKDTNGKQGVDGRDKPGHDEKTDHAAKSSFEATVESALSR